MPSFAFLYTKERIVGERSTKALKLGREWTVNPGYRWRPTDREWDAILQQHGDTIRSRFLAESGVDLNTPAAKQQLLEFWLTTEEEGYQILPTADGEALVAYLMALKKAEVPLPEAKE